MSTFVRWRKARNALKAADGVVELSGRSHKILALGAAAWSRPEIGVDLGLTPERVRQLEESALGIVRKKSIDTPQGFYFYDRWGDKQ